MLFVINYIVNLQVWILWQGHQPTVCERAGGEDGGGDGENQGRGHHWLPGTVDRRKEEETERINERNIIVYQVDRKTEEEMEKIKERNVTG